MLNIMARTLVISWLISYAALGAAMGVNPVTITFENGTIEFPQNSPGTANYLVSVDSAVMPAQYQLILQLSNPRSWYQQLTDVASACTTATTTCGAPMVLTAGETCCLMLNLNGAQLHAGSNYPLAPVLTTNPATYQAQAAALNVSVTAPTTTITANVTNLTLAVNNPGLNAALTGTPRTITITNTGTSAALHVTYTASPALPAGTSISPTSCSTLAPGSTCVLTITPGSTPSANPGTLSPTPISLSINGNNTNTVTPAISIVTYGSVYQGGYVFAVDDTTPTTGNIGGKVVATVDQVTTPPGIIWSSNTSGNYDGGVSIWGIDSTSTPSSPSPNATSTAPATQYMGQYNCSGATDGTCDSNNINAYYIEQLSVNNDNYAAGICVNTINGYTDWYLPAICEMGYNTTSGNFGCGAKVSPTIQNIQASLVDNGDIGSLTGVYWSATEDPNSTQLLALFHSFNTSTPIQSGDDKSSQYGVRCVRALVY